MAVHYPARRLDEADVLDLADMGRTLEHHVLEKVGETGPALGFGPEPDVVHDGHPDQVVGTARYDEHFQAVVEHGPFEMVALVGLAAWRDASRRRSPSGPNCTLLVGKARQFLVMRWRGARRTVDAWYGRCAARLVGQVPAEPGRAVLCAHRARHRTGFYARNCELADGQHGETGYAAVAPSQTKSYYEGTANPAAMYRQGELAGRSGAEGIVILDFGRPAVGGSVYGTFGYGNVLIPFASISAGVESYIKGYYRLAPPVHHAQRGGRDQQQLRDRAAVRPEPGHMRLSG